MFLRLHSDSTIRHSLQQIIYKSSKTTQEYIQPTYCVGLLQMTALAAHNGPLAPGANHYHHATPLLLLGESIVVLVFLLSPFAF